MKVHSPIFIRISAAGFYFVTKFVPWRAPFASPSSVGPFCAAAKFSRDTAAAASCLEEFALPRKLIQFIKYSCEAL